MRMNLNLVKGNGFVGPEVRMVLSVNIFKSDGPD